MTGPAVKLGLQYGISTSKKRKPFPEINKFRDFVVKELERRKNFSSTITESPNVPTTPFVKMTSCMNVEKNSFLTLGMHGYEASDDIFETVYGKYGNGGDFVGYSYEAGKHVKIYAPKADKVLSARGKHPSPGIISVKVNRLRLGMPFRSRVTWKCYNIEQLEFLREYFLRPSQYIVLEWGHKSVESSTKFSPLNFGNSEETLYNLAHVVISGREATVIPQIESASGNYDYVIGFVNNFTIASDGQNGYECSTEIMSPGEATYGIFSEENLIDLKDPSNIKTISDYFKYGGPMDAIISAQLIDGNIIKVQGENNWKYYARTATGASLVTGDNGRETFSDGTFITREGDSTFVAEDGLFMRWEYFIDGFIPTMTSALRAEKIIKLPQLDEPIFGPFVGYNRFLKSIDPEVMIFDGSENRSAGTMPSGFDRVAVAQADAAGITPKPGTPVTTTVSPDNVTAQKIAANEGIIEELATPKFGMEQNGARLSQGIWINIGAIVQSFLETNTFYDGLQSLLNKMSRASAGYWNLQIFFSDEQQKYYIIDTNFGKIPTDKKEFYIFNAKDKSELLGLEFNGTLSSAQKTQMMLAGIENGDPHIGETNNVVSKESRPKIENGDLLRKKIQLLSPSPKNIERTAAQIFADITSAQNSINTSYSEIEKIATVLNSDIRVASNVNAGKKTLPGSSQSATFINTGNLRGGKDSQFNAPRYKNGAFDHLHEGLDSPMPRGTSVKSAAQGRVVMIHDSPNPPAGKYVNILHEIKGERYVSRYLHLDDISVFPSNNSLPTQMEIGKSGDSGCPGSLHLHFEIRKIPDGMTDSELASNGKPGIAVNPKSLFLLGGSLMGASPEDVINMPLNPASDYAAQLAANVQQQNSKLQDYYKELDAKEAKIKEDLAANRIISNNREGLQNITVKNEEIEAQLKRDLQYITTERANLEKNKLSSIKIAEGEVDAKIQKLLTDKFSTKILNYVERNPSQMRALITLDGELEENKAKSNAFGYPIMTQFELDLVIKGIGGISSGDAFFVDKLPGEYKKIGLFQIFGTEENISIATGWTTRINARFKICWSPTNLLRVGGT